ncbi:MULTISPECIES: hypothetical protein [unclassified Ruegeria]|uniref:hypothetical protein n=1 Tax=unclassified Ruegeria TaxID=2625375 RepID=UPI001492A613|nr:MULTISPECIES: hypothetical protein [unclassified Ruegeria]NOC45915.1 hypothetical protein [Ruegeria sp. HKCCD7559]NOD84749.1 hypothetical protein [Ruegeria sp. HKCCD6119]
MSVEKKVWLISGLLTFGLAALLLKLWIELNHFEEDLTQLPDQASVDAYLCRMDVAPDYRLRTGIFIKSFSFLGASDVRLTGYIWQHYKAKEHDAILPAEGEVGFLLPEAVDTASGLVEEAYRLSQPDGVLIGWYFEQTLRQSFDYTSYPFDHKTVWVRFSPASFEVNIALVPDFEAYPATGSDDIFGIDNRIVMGTWERENTYFDYKLSKLDTTLGIRQNAYQTNTPELHYNFVIKRNFANAFIVHMIPLLVVVMLLFGAVMTVTRREGLVERHDFSTSSVIGTCSVLFFVILLAHVQLREGFAGSPVIYMESFFFLMYFMLLAVSINTYLFASEAVPSLRIIHYRDNLIPKASFWPFVLLCMVAITAYNLGIKDSSEPPPISTRDC